MAKAKVIALRPQPLGELTGLEVEVLRLATSSVPLTVPQVAARLRTSTAAAERELTSAREKLAARDLAQARELSRAQRSL